MKRSNTARSFEPAAVVVGRAWKLGRISSDDLYWTVEGIHRWSGWSTRGQTLWRGTCNKYNNDYWSLMTKNHATRLTVKQRQAEWQSGRVSGVQRQYGWFQISIWHIARRGCFTRLGICSGITLEQADD